MQFLGAPFNCSIDNDAYSESVKQSTTPGIYMTSRPMINECHMDIPRGNGRFTPAEYIDASSELSLRPYKLTHDPSKQFQRSGVLNCKTCVKCEKGLPCQCHHCLYENHFVDCKDTSILIGHNSRVFKACRPMEESVLNRWEPLSMDLQNLKYIQDNSYIGINSREYARVNLKK